MLDGSRTRYFTSGQQAEKGEYKAAAVILACGSYTPFLVKASGINLPVKPAKGYSISIPAMALGPKVPIIDDGLHAAVTPLDDKIRVAGTAEFAGYDLSISKRRIQNLVALFRDIYPDLASGVDPEMIEEWAGLRPMSVDGIPVIGATSVEGLYLNTGHMHLGWTMAAGSGKLLADLIMQRATAINPSPYSPARFAAKT